VNHCGRAPDKVAGAKDHRNRQSMMRWVEAAVSLNGGGAPVTFDGFGRVQRHPANTGKMRCNFN
jgi:hypothetical protein